MIRILPLLLFLALGSCSNSSQENPAPPPEPPAASTAAAPAAKEAPPEPASKAVPELAPDAQEPPKPAPLPRHSNPRNADLAMAVNTTSDLQLISKQGSVTKEGVVIKGKVKNTTDKDYHFVEISFKLYDQDKKELAIVRGTTDSLEAGRTWYFEVKAPYPNAVASILDRLGGF